MGFFFLFDPRQYSRVFVSFGFHIFLGCHSLKLVFKRELKEKITVIVKIKVSILFTSSVAITLVEGGGTRFCIGDV